MKVASLISLRGTLGEIIQTAGHSFVVVDKIFTMRRDWSIRTGLTSKIICMNNLVHFSVHSTRTGFLTIRTYCINVYVHT